MLQAQENRRVRRSKNAKEALELQLAAAADRAGFSTMVFADEVGLVIAAHGSPAIGEQLAAISPVLAPDMHVWHGTVQTTKGVVRLTVAPFRLGESVLYVSATEGRPSAISRELFMSGRGATRILS